MTDLTSTSPQPPGIPNRSITLALFLGLVMGAIGLVAVSGGLLLYRRERKKTAKHYGPTRTSKHGKYPQDMVALSQRMGGSSSNSTCSSHQNSVDHTQRKEWKKSLGHKIELAARGSERVTTEMDIIVLESKQEDPTFMPQPRPIVGPATAPASQALSSILSALPPGVSATVPAIVPLRGVDYDMSAGKEAGTGSLAPQLSPYNPNFP